MAKESAQSENPLNWSVPGNKKGLSFAVMTSQRLLESRIRRNVEYQILSNSLLDATYEYEILLPRDFFLQSLSESDERLYSQILEQMGDDPRFTVPVFITDIRSHQSDFSLVDGSGSHVSVPNRYEAANLWGNQLLAAFLEARRKLCEEVPPGFEAQKDRLHELMDDSRYLDSVRDVLWCIAWTSGKDTSKRYNRFKPTCYDISGFEKRLGASLYHKRPSKRDRKINGWYYEGMPAGSCPQEIDTLRLFFWAAQEVSIDIPDNLDWVSSDLLKKPGSAERTSIERMIEGVETISEASRKIQEDTYMNRDQLRLADKDCRLDIVFSRTCPVINPLLYARAFAKGVKSVALEKGDDVPGPRELLDYYIESSRRYVEVVELMISLIVANCGGDEGWTERQRQAGLERAYFALNAFSVIRMAYDTLKVFAILEARPDERIFVKLKTLRPTEADFQRTEISEKNRDEHIRTELLRDSVERNFKSTAWLWFFVFRNRVRYWLRSYAIMFIRHSYNMIIKVWPKNWRFRQAGKGFLYRGILTGKMKGRPYRVSTIKGVIINNFADGDTRTEHLAVRTHETEFEIRPETTYIGTNERVIMTSLFRKWFYSRKFSERVFKWLKMYALFPNYVEGPDQKEKYAQTLEEILEKQTGWWERLGTRINRQIVLRCHGPWKRLFIYARRINISLRDAGPPRRVPADSVFERAFLTDDYSYFHAYSTRVEGERVLDFKDRMIVSKKGVREVSALGYEWRKVVREYRLPWTLFLGLRLKPAIAHAYQIITLAFYSIVGVSSLFLAKYLMAPNTGAKERLLGPTVTIMITGLTLMMAIIAFFLSAQGQHVFTESLTSFYRRCMYVAIVIQTVVLVWFGVVYI